MVVNVKERRLSTVTPSFLTSLLREIGQSPTLTEGIGSAGEECEEK